MAKTHATPKLRQLHIPPNVRQHLKITPTDHLMIKSEDKIQLRTNVILSATRALLGTITTNLRGVTIDYDTNRLILKAYFDKGATAEDKELLSIALTEIVADLYQEIKKFDYEPVDLLYPTKMEVLKDWIYLRYEDII